MRESKFFLVFYYYLLFIFNNVSHFYWVCLPLYIWDCVYQQYVTVSFARSGGPEGQNVNKDSFIVLFHFTFCHAEEAH